MPGCKRWTDRERGGGGGKALLRKELAGHFGPSGQTGRRDNSLSKALEVP